MRLVCHCLLLWTVLSHFAGEASLAQDKKHAAITPVARDPAWMKRHEKFVEIAKRGDVDLLLLGDALTDAWGGEGHDGGRGAKIFEKEFLPLKAANFGLNADRTQHLLWRLQNDELTGIQPRAVMLLIGTNNSNGNDNTAEEIADGIKVVVAEIHKRSPKSRVLLLGIFPRGEKPNPQREKIAEVNKLISKLDDGGKTVRYLDIGAKFLTADGTLTLEISHNYLHLTEKGYQIWADAVREPLKDLLKP